MSKTHEDLGDILTSLYEGIATVTPENDIGFEDLFEKLYNSIINKQPSPPAQSRSNL